MTTRRDSSRSGSTTRLVVRLRCYQTASVSSLCRSTYIHTYIHTSYIHTSRPTDDDNENTNVSTDEDNRNSAMMIILSFHVGHNLDVPMLQPSSTCDHHCNCFRNVLTPD